MSNRAKRGKKEEAPFVWHGASSLLYREKLHISNLTCQICGARFTVHYIHNCLQLQLMARCSYMQYSFPVQQVQNQEDLLC